MIIAKEKMSVSLLGVLPFKTSGADHRMLPTDWAVPLDEPEDVTIDLSGLVTSRLQPAIQAWPLLSIRIFDLGGQVSFMQEVTVGYKHVPR